MGNGERTCLIHPSPPPSTNCRSQTPAPSPRQTSSQCVLSRPSTSSPRRRGGRGGRGQRVPLRRSSSSRTCTLKPTRRRLQACARRRLSAAWALARSSFAPTARCARGRSRMPLRPGAQRPGCSTRRRSATGSEALPRGCCARTLLRGSRAWRGSGSAARRRSLGSPRLTLLCPPAPTFASTAARAGGWETGPRPPCPRPASPSSRPTRPAGR
mmetsp:Transcript_28997/g.93157  ORF Transcript_28997/g.93157 Transcript_28997/m.93157 type:complete len:213 (-) Transcript_28997:2149-2787(-)